MKRDPNAVAHDRANAAADLRPPDQIRSPDPAATGSRAKRKDDLNLPDNTRSEKQPQSELRWLALAKALEAVDVKITNRTGQHLAAHCRNRARSRSYAAKPAACDPSQVSKLLLLPGVRSPPLRGREMPAVAIPGREAPVARVA